METSSATGEVLWGAIAVQRKPQAYLHRPVRISEIVESCSLRCGPAEALFALSGCSGRCELVFGAATVTAPRCQRYPFLS